ncbi:hypothetical protein [Caballeronia sp. LZ034LL]|uniref:hypothetical protein n=1 Tax=Caballeronia sp. LZ034LL TaxID=3038567 RepID=UPI0028603D55|nr:hypothetical protein [Caballeronia sp. LZ034LL]MDR5838053.1 hypothetical protein [Caballeronia sp. LZ034LL]
MKRRRTLKTIGLISLWFFLSYKLGIFLLRYIDAHIEACPEWIERSVRFALDSFGYSDVRDPETVGSACGLFALVLCRIFVAMTLLLIFRSIVRVIQNS